MTYETLSDQIKNEIIKGPKTVDELLVLIPGHKRSTFRGELSRLCSINFCVKNENKFEMSPAYKRSNNL